MYTQDAVRVLASSRYLHWGVVQISLANLIVIVAMVVIFALALVLPFPHGRSEENATGEPDVER